MAKLKPLSKVPFPKPEGGLDTVIWGSMGTAWSTIGILFGFLAAAISIGDGILVPSPFALWVVAAAGLALMGFSAYWHRRTSRRASKMLNSTIEAVQAWTKSSAGIELDWDNTYELIQRRTPLIMPSGAMIEMRLTVEDTYGLFETTSGRGEVQVH